MRWINNVGQKDTTKYYKHTHAVELQPSCIIICCDPQHDTLADTIQSIGTEILHREPVPFSIATWLEVSGVYESTYKNVLGASQKAENDYLWPLSSNDNEHIHRQAQYMMPKISLKQ